MNEQYLPEDQDLLGELEQIGPMSTGAALAEQKRKISEIQIESILRSRKTTADLSKSTDKYSIVLIAFAMAQIIIGFMQLALSVFPISSKTGGVLYIITVAVTIIFVMKKFMEVDK
jgi:hypothetical protein